MEKRLMLFIAAFFLMIGTALAQTKVNGTVTSQDDGQPVIGASVLVVGTQVGTVTDANGRFELSVPEGKSTLRITYVGMEPIEVSARPNMRIMLTSDQKALDEVIVVAYGTAKRSAFTGSAGVLNASEISKVQVQNPVNALTGKVAGVQINTASGQPGSNPTVRIRGISSINAGNAPLYVVDGVPFDGDLNDINPQDILSMTVLKDAASAALYGARGANGVIILTTKKGDRGKATITVDAKWGSNSRAVPDYNYVTSPARYYEMWYSALKNYKMNAEGASDAAAHAWANQNLTVDDGTYGLGYNVYTYPEGEYLIGSNGRLNPNATLGRIIEADGAKYTLRPDDWVDASYKNSLRQEYSMTATGGNEKGSFYGSVNYLNNQGITVASDYKRFTGRLKADYQFKPWLKLGANMSYTHFNANSLDEDGSSTSSANIFALTKMAPIYPIFIRDENGNVMYNPVAKINVYDYGDASEIGIERPYFSGANPLGSNQLDKNNSEGNTFNVVGTAEITLPYGFKFTSTNSVFTSESRGTTTVNPFYGQYASENGQIYKSHARTWAYNYQQLLNWHKLYGKHDIAAMIGHEYYRSRYYYLSGGKSGTFDPEAFEMAGAIKDGSSNSYTTDYNTEGWFGRLQYNYDERYFASLSYRRDASSRFHPDNRWGSFWSFGAAWMLSKESFFNVSWIDELKLKVSYGEQGNDQIGNYRYTTLYGIVNNDYLAGVLPSALGNPNISWEKNGNFNAGVDFSFFKGRLSGNVEFFTRKTSDMLSSLPLAPSYGFRSKMSNVGDMRNTGFEIELQGVILKKKDFSWDAFANITFQKNKIIRLADESKTMETDGVKGYSSGNYYYGEGESIYTYRMKSYAGVYGTNTWQLTSDTEYDENKGGMAMYWQDTKDADGNVTGQTATTDYSAATYHLHKTAMPAAFGGFGTNVAWKGFDFSIAFSYQLGGKVYDSDYQAAMGVDPGHIMHVDMQNAWTPTNQTNIPRLQFDDDYTNSTSDRFLVSASYLSLNNINFGYTLPFSLTSKIDVQKIRLYVTADNIWVWSKRQGLDPRQSISGSVTSAYYAPMRTISGGISVTF